MANSLWVNTPINGVDTWYNVPGGVTPFNVNTGASVPIAPLEMYAKSNNTWYSVWTKSDPLTVAFPSGSNTGVNAGEAFRKNSGVYEWQTSQYGLNEITVGAALSSTSGALYNWVGIFQFPSSFRENINAVLAERPYIKSATITMQRESSTNGAGGLYAYGTMYTTTYNESIFDNNGTTGTKRTPSYSYVDLTTPNIIASTTFPSTTPGNITWGDVITINVSTTAISEVAAGKNLCVLAVNSNLDSTYPYSTNSSTPSYNMDKIFSRYSMPLATPAYQPILTVTFDYV